MIPTEITDLAERLYRQRKAHEEQWLQGVMERYAPAIARAVAKRQALQFCANWLARRGFRTVVRQYDRDWMGLSINGKIVAETRFPSWETKFPSWMMETNYETDH